MRGHRLIGIIAVLVSAAVAVAGSAARAVNGNPPYWIEQYAQDVNRNAGGEQATLGGVPRLPRNGLVGAEPILEDVSALTGAILVKMIRDAVNGIIDHVDNSVKDVARQATAGLLQLASQLEQTLGENINKPISELTGTLRTEVDRGLAALHQTQYFLRATTTCLSTDIRGMLAAFDRTFTANLSSAIPWASNQPVVTNIRKVSASAPYGLRVGETQTLIIEGANLDADQSCGLEARLEHAEPGSTGPIPAVRVLGTGPRQTTVAVDPFEQTGTCQ